MILAKNFKVTLVFFLRSVIFGTSKTKSKIAAYSPIDIRPQRSSRRRRTLSSSLCSSSFEDQYELDQRGTLGEGAYGSVYRCYHKITEIEYAVKIIDKRLGARRQKVPLLTSLGTKGVPIGLKFVRIQ